MTTLRSYSRLFFRRLPYAVVWYALLMVPWPGCRAAYAYVFRAIGDALFRPAFQDARIWLEADADGAAARAPPGGYDSKLVVVNRRNGARAQTHLNTRFIGYMPTALLVALVLATPLPWSRRARALVWGLLLAEVYVMARVALIVLALVCRPRGLFAPPPFWGKLLEFHAAVTVGEAYTSLLPPLVIWILLTLRRQDMILLGSTRRGPCPAAAALDGLQPDGGVAEAGPRRGPARVKPRRTEIG